MRVDRRLLVVSGLLLLGTLCVASCVASGAEGEGSDGAAGSEDAGVSDVASGGPDEVVDDIGATVDIADAGTIPVDVASLPVPDAGPDALVDTEPDVVVRDVAPGDLVEVGPDAGLDAGEAGPVCDPAALEGRCCCGYGARFAPRCEDDGTWSCQSILIWAEGEACEGTPCGGPCGPPCPNVCDAPDTDPGCPAGFVAIEGGACVPGDCAAEDAEPAACTAAPVMIWEGTGSFPGESACEISCGPDVPCVPVGSWSGTIPLCFSAPISEIDGVYRTEDAGLCWERAEGLDVPFRVASVVGMAHVPAPYDAVLLLAAGGIWRSTDGGRSFSFADSPDPQGANLIKVCDDGVVYLVARDPPREDDWQIWRSDDGGAHFSAAPGLSSSRLMNRLAVHPESSDVLLVTGLFNAASGYFVAMRSTDGGDTFQGVGPRVTDSRHKGGGVAFSSSSPSRAYLAVAEHGLYRSDDAGASWTQVSAGYAPSTLSVHPEDPDGLYALGQVSWDGGQTWAEAAEDDTATFFPDRDVVCPDDGGPCDRWSRGSWIRYASGDEPWRAAMGGLPWSLYGVYWSRPLYFLPLGDGRALSIVLTQQMLLF